ncbi:MAG: hypothetical protein ACFFCW_37620 [Candidatus Hodarchaeota archaeon]
MSDTRVLAWSKKFSIAGITENIIHRSIDYVREFNLKTSDVTHLVTAKATAFHLIMIDDKNFQCFKQVQDIGLLQITHPSLEFKKRINKYLS